MLKFYSFGPGANSLKPMLAAILNTSLSTVKHWEIGIKRPGGTSAKLLDILQRKGVEALT